MSPVHSTSTAPAATLNGGTSPLVLAGLRSPSVWQVDIALENDVLWVHPKITNPRPIELKGYWWTCVAMHVDDNTRIVAPAKTSATPCADWPYVRPLAVPTCTRPARPARPARVHRVSPCKACAHPSLQYDDRCRYGAYTLDNVTFKGAAIDQCRSHNGGKGGCAWQQDMSYLGNIPSAHDFFFQIYKPQQPYIAHVSSDGFTNVHG